VQKKTDFGKGQTELVIRSVPGKWLSPWFHVDHLVNRVQLLRVYDALFCSKKGRKYKRSDSICNTLKRLLRRMGVEGFTGYLFWYSIIQTLIDAGLDEKEVNSYTGHSNDSPTVQN
jgi:site-specific recombinase XerD